MPTAHRRRDTLVISTDDEHQLAMDEVELLMEAKEGSPESHRLSELADAIVAYEKVRWPIGE